MTTGPTAFDFMSAAEISATQARSFTTDVTQPILNAMNCAEQEGFTDLLFPPGGYAVSQSLPIGNGSAAAASTIMGVKLKGAGPPVGPPLWAAYSRTPPTELRWVSMVPAPMVAVNGPLQGWGVENLYLNGQNIALYGIAITSGQFGDVANVSLAGFSSAALVSTTFPVFDGNCTDSLHNAFRNLNIQVPGVYGAKGIVLTGGPNATTDFADFSNVLVAMSGGSTNFGLYLQAADTCMFRNLHICGGPGTTAIVFDYTVSGTFPSSCMFFGIDTGSGNTTYCVAGTPGPGATPNKMYGRSGLNGMPPPTGIPNLIEV